MAQHDGNIANQAMPQARTDINNALSAILTLQSGSSAPSVTFANMFWVDTVNNLLKQRNTADSAWLTKYALDGNGLNRLNAGNPNGSITGAFEGELLYDTTNDLLWVYSGSSTVWYSIGGIKSGSLPTNYHDIRIEYVSVSQIKILAGSRCRSSDDTTDLIFTTDQTINITASGANGLDAGSESSNTWYYLYAIYNPTTLTSALIFSTVNEVATGSIVLPSGFTKKRQLKFAVRNNASSNFIPFVYYPLESRIEFRDFEFSSIYQVLNVGRSATFVTINNNSLIPPISLIGNFSQRTQFAGSTLSGGYGVMRTTGSGVTVGEYVGASGANTATFNSAGQIDLRLNSSQQFDYLVTNTEQGLSVWVKGCKITEVI